MRVSFFLFVLLIFYKSYSQKIELPTDSLNKIAYQEIKTFDKSEHNELFNYAIQYIHSKLQNKYSIIRNDTIIFSHYIQAYSTEYGGLTKVGLIKCKVVVTIDKTDLKISLNNFFYIDYETKDTIAAEDIYTKNVISDKWHCLYDIDESSKKFIENFKWFILRKTDTEESEDYNVNKIKNIEFDHNSVGGEVIIASRRLFVGIVITTIGSALTVISSRDYADNSSMKITGLLSMAIGLTFTINGTMHLNKAGLIMESEKQIKKTSLLFKIGANNIGLAYKF